MSRCFPFPPPGYEKKPKAENLDLLKKEKRKEKKHKKEKKDREKREHKEKREKDRSKDKPKEKKDRKEKHKDRKKDKDIDKARPSEDRRAEDHRNDGPKAEEEGKDSKFAEELGRRVRDNGADYPMAGTITTSIHEKIEPMGFARPSLEKESRFADKKVFPAPIGGGGGSSSQRNDAHRRTGNNVSTATPVDDRERSKLHQRFTVGINTDQNRNHGTSRSNEGPPELVNRKAECSAAGMEKEKILVSNSIDNNNNKGKLGAKVVASNPSSTKRKNDFSGLPVENLSSVRSKAEPMGGGMFPHPFISEQRRNTAIFQPAQKDKSQKVAVDKRDEVSKGFEGKEHTAKKNKPMDADKYTKEKEEKIAEKSASIENNNIRNFGKKDQIDALNNKPLAPHKDNTAAIKGVDETSIKRKNLKINGFIQENDGKPNKIPRLVASSSSQPISNLPLKPDRILDPKEKDMNGIREVSSKSPHPDSKHLERIYAVPKTEPLLENDDLEWLFDRRNSSQKKPERRRPASEAAQVWAQAMWIESADVLALPYVLPF